MSRQQKQIQDSNNPNGNLLTLTTFFMVVPCVACIHRSCGRAQRPADSKRHNQWPFQAVQFVSVVEPSGKPRTKHVHRPGAHLHRQADPADAALHLLGDADLGHLYFKFVPHVQGSLFTCRDRCNPIRIIMSHAFILYISAQAL